MWSISWVSVSWVSVIRRFQLKTGDELAGAVKLFNDPLAVAIGVVTQIDHDELSRREREDVSNV